VPEVVHLLERAGRGPVWGTESEDLNATLLVWPAGEATPEHVNAERDVLVVVLDGDGTAEVDGEEVPLAAGTALLVPKGARRRIVAGAGGIRYLTTHRRRGGLSIAKAPSITGGAA
jgi:quercetin dioxygenase-like cupin family protein